MYSIIENGGDNVCGDAFKYVWVTICLVLLVILINFVLIVMAIMDEYARQHAPNHK